jgi:GntR family transcriptional repressor for pyruvate dehydrogenase complex
MSSPTPDPTDGLVVAERAAAPVGLPIIYAPRGFRGADGAANGRGPKAAELTAARIVDDIMSGGVRVGEKLPTEAEMLERYGVSRESLREALRLLEIQGILEIRRGPGGGPLVAPLNSGYLARTSSLYFHLSGATYAELFDTWATMEPALAARVAGLPNRKAKRDIFSRFIQYDTEEHVELELFDDFNGFHSLIAELSGNRVLTLVTQSVTHIIAEQVLTSLDPISERSMLSHSHADIAEAIVDGRATKARTLMADHIQEVADSYIDLDPDSGQRQIEWRL